MVEFTGVASHSPPTHPSLSHAPQNAQSLRGIPALLAELDRDVVRLLFHGHSPLL